MNNEQILDNFRKHIQKIFSSPLKYTDLDDSIQIIKKKLDETLAELDKVNDLVEGRDDGEHNAYVTSLYLITDDEIDKARVRFEKYLRQLHPMEASEILEKMMNHVNQKENE